MKSRTVLTDGQHVVAAASAPVTSNPKASDAFNVAVTVPEQITIRMVDASALADYEVWIFIASILSSAFVGFLIAYVQTESSESSASQPYFWMTVLVGILFVTTLAKALFTRHRLSKKGRELKLKTQPIED